MKGATALESTVFGVGGVIPAAAVDAADVECHSQSGRFDLLLH